MKITCYCCNKSMTLPGAIVFSPPVKSKQDMSVSTVHKYHVCLDCWEKLFKLIEHLDDAKIVKEKK